MNSPIRIVLVGGGYASLQAYRAIVKRMRRRVLAKQVRITVVSPTKCHQFHGWSVEVLQGIVAPEHHLTSLRELMPLAEFVPGSVVSVDRVACELSVQLNLSLGTLTLGYDHLLLGAGSSDDTCRVPGLAAHAFGLKRSDGVVRLREHLVSVVELASAVTDAARRDELLSFVFLGGGYMGVELCAGVAEMLGQWRSRYPVLQAFPPKFYLIHASEQLLPGLAPGLRRIADYAKKQLEAYGVEVLGGTGVKAVHDHVAVLDDGRKIAARTLVVALGQRPVLLIGTEHLPRAGDGRLLAEPSLQVQGESRLWVGGDAGYVAHPRRSGPCPATAFWAIRHGTHIGKNIVRCTEDQPLKPFDTFPLGESASFGIGKGVAELNGIVVFGWLAWVNRLAFFLCFMPHWRQATRVLFDWLTFALLGAKASHLESTVGRAGESGVQSARTPAVAIPALQASPLTLQPTHSTLQLVHHASLSASQASPSAPLEGARPDLASAVSATYSR